MPRNKWRKQDGIVFVLNEGVSLFCPHKTELSDSTTVGKHTYYCVHDEQRSGDCIFCPEVRCELDFNLYKGLLPFVSICYSFTNAVFINAGKYEYWRWNKWQWWSDKACITVSILNWWHTLTSLKYLNNLSFWYLITLVFGYFGTWPFGYLGTRLFG